MGAMPNFRFTEFLEDRLQRRSSHLAYVWPLTRLLANDSEARARDEGEATATNDSFGNADNDSEATARELGISIEWLRAGARRGYFSPAPSDRNGHRYYTEEDVKRMRSRSSRQSQHRASTKRG